MASDKNQPVPATPPPGPVQFTAHAADRLNLAIFGRRYFQLILRRWPILLLSTLVGFGYNTYKAVTSPDIFQSFSMLRLALRVQAGTENKVNVLEAADNNSYYNDQPVKMQSTPVQESVIAHLRAKSYGDRLLPWHDIKATRSQATFFRLNVESTDLDFARQYAKAWAEEFVKARSEEVQSALSSKQRITEEQLEIWNRRLDKARADIKEFQRTNSIVDVKQQLEEARQQLNHLKAEHSDREFLRKRLVNMNNEDLARGAWGPASTRPNKEKGAGEANAPEGKPETRDPLAKFAEDSKLSNYRFQVQTNQSYRAKLLQDLREKHPAVQEVDAAIASLEQNISFELAEINARKIARIKELELEENSYLPLITNAQTRVDRLMDIRVNFSTLQEEEARFVGEIQNFRDIVAKVEVARGSKEEEWDITESGVTQPTPIRPNRRDMIVKGLLAGILVGLAIIFLLHRLDDRLDLAEDIERELEEPVLGQVPQMDMKALKADRLLVTNLPQDDMFAESIRGVRSTLLMTVGAGSKRVFVITSAVPGDGKTTFTVNFAATLAITGARVLLLDADLRRGSTHLYFGHKREHGLSDVLSGEVHWTDVLKETEVKTLNVITTGHLPANPGELLLGEVASQFLAEARAAYDYVIIDTPPLTSINDTFALVNYSDGLIFVVRAGQTSMRFAKNAVGAIRQRGTKVLGLVLNGITSDNPYYYYHYYYHAYYTHEQKDQTARAVSSRPAKTMAAPRRVAQLASIDAEARTKNGERVSYTKLAEEERAKIGLYKARRSAKSGAGSSDAGVASESPAPATEPGINGHASVTPAAADSQDQNVPPAPPAAA